MIQHNRISLFVYITNPSPQFTSGRVSIGTRLPWFGTGKDIKSMQLVNELENDLAFAALVDKQSERTIDSNQVLPLIHRIRAVLEPVSERDHAYNKEAEKSSLPEPSI